MELKLYQIDAFTGRLFAGNPAAVCPLTEWLPERLMQCIAAENNLSETAFFVPEGGRFRIRWFTPVAEVDLCGHATLASAFVLFDCLVYSPREVVFVSRSGELVVRQEDGRLEMDFPSQPAVPCGFPDGIVEGLGHRPLEVLKTDDYIAVLKREEDVRDCVPDLARLGQIEARGICITAPGIRSDFVSRFFAPRHGIPEDPVTGSSHCALVPYWSRRLGRTTLYARQLSRRGGELWCELKGGRVLIAGQAVKFMEATINC